jgi:hypothetical protein
LKSEDNMSEKVFYVGAEKERQLTGYVPAKFLMRNGMYVTDPTPGGSQRVPLFSDGMGSNRTGGGVANPNNYLIVPANYSDRQARDFAAGIADTIGRVYPEDEAGAAGPNQAREQMTAAFMQGGSQDLQRHPQWGIPKGSVVPAFVGSASNHLGYVTGMAGLPVEWPEIAGGALNILNADVIQPIRRLTRQPATSIDASGPYGLSPQNYANIAQGYSDGLAASKPLSPFNGFGQGAQPLRTEGQIGDGNGVADWMSSLSGVDPQEPAPPAWPPQVDAPIRYLSRRTYN